MRRIVEPAWLIVAALLLLNLMVAVAWPNAGSSLIATALFVVVTAALFIRNTTAMWLLLPLILTLLSVMISLNVIEAGGYMVEMGEQGHASCAAASYSCYALIFLGACLAVFARFSAPARAVEAQHGQDTHAILQWPLVAAGVLCVTYLLLAGLRTGFPLLTGTDRFVYRRLYADVISVNILDQKLIPPAVLGTLAAFGANTWTRRLGLWIFLALMILSFLYGDKFFIILVSIASFTVAFVISRPDSALQLLRRLAPLIALGIAAVLAVTFLIYSDYGTNSVQDTLVRFGDRVTGQGQLWYVAVEHSSRLVAFERGLVVQNLASLVAPNSQEFAFEHHLGALYFVEHFSPPAMFRSFQHNAGFVTPTMAFEAYGLVMFGYLGLAVQMAVAGALVGCLMAWLYRSIRSANAFAVLLPAFVMNQTIKLLSQGTLYIILSISALKSYAAFLVLQALVSLISRGMRSPDHATRRASLPG